MGHSFPAAVADELAAAYLPNSELTFEEQVRLNPGLFRRYIRWTQGKPAGTHEAMEIHSRIAAAKASLLEEFPDLGRVIIALDAAQQLPIAYSELAGIDSSRQFELARLLLEFGGTPNYDLED